MSRGGGKGELGGGERLGRNGWRGQEVDEAVHREFRAGRAPDPVKASFQVSEEQVISFCPPC